MMSITNLYILFYHLLNLFLKNLKLVAYSVPSIDSGTEPNSTIAGINNEAVMVQEVLLILLMLLLINNYIRKIKN